MPELIHRLPLDAPAELWAERILGPRRLRGRAQEDALRAVCASDFEIQRSATRLLEVYRMQPGVGSGAASGSPDVR